MAQVQLVAARGASEIRSAALSITLGRRSCWAHSLFRPARVALKRFKLLPVEGRRAKAEHMPATTHRSAGQFEVTLRN